MWSSTKWSHSGLMRPVWRVPTQCEIPPMAASPTQNAGMLLYGKFCK